MTLSVFIIIVSIACKYSYYVLSANKLGYKFVSYLQRLQFIFQVGEALVYGILSRRHVRNDFVDRILRLRKR